MAKSNEPGEIDWFKQEAKARRVAARNTARINSGETFRSGKPSGPQPAPSKTDGKK